jgi:hypothetical protein
VKQYSENPRYRSALSETRARCTTRPEDTGHSAHAPKIGDYRSPGLAGREAPELVAAVVHDRCPVGEQQMVEVNLGGEPGEAIA